MQSFTDQDMATRVDEKKERKRERERAREGERESSISWVIWKPNKAHAQDLFCS